MILSLAAGVAPLKTRAAVAGDGRGQHFALFEQRRDEAEHLAAMLRAFADREDVGVARSPCSR